MQRTTPLFAAWCAADPGSTNVALSWVPALRSSV